MRAHAAPGCQKSLYRYPVADMKLCNSSGYIPDGHHTRFKFGLALDAGFQLLRTVREFEVHQRQPGGRVA